MKPKNSHESTIYLLKHVDSWQKEVSEKFLHSCLTYPLPASNLHISVTDSGWGGLLISSRPHLSAGRQAPMLNKEVLTQHVPFGKPAGSAPALQWLWSQQQGIHIVLFQWDSLGSWSPVLQAIYRRILFLIQHYPGFMSFGVHRSSAVSPASWKLISIRVLYGLLDAAVTNLCQLGT